MPRPSRSAFGLVLLLAIVAAADTLCMPAVFWAGDPAAWREETKAMMQGQLAVDSALAERFGGTGQYFVLNASGAQPRWYSKYGIANSIMSLPPMIVDQWRGGRPRRSGEPPDLLIFNVYQIFLSLLTCAILYRLSGWYTSRVTTRVIYVLCVMYTTYLWYYQRAQSSELYQVLFYSTFFHFFVIYLRTIQQTEGRLKTRSHVAMLAAWVSAACLALTRVLFGLLIPVTIVIAAFAIWRLGPELRRRVAAQEAGVLVLPPLAIVGVLGVVNWFKFGSPLLTGYHVWRPEMHWPAWAYWDGLSGYILDMQGSVLWYFPVLLFAFVAFGRFARRYVMDAIVMCVVFGLFLLVLGKTPTWRGDWTYGPRYMLFGLPVLAMPFVTWVDGLLDAPRRWKCWTAGTVTAVTLLYSGYLTERQNRLEFFVTYRVSEELEPFWNREMARYFVGHHTGWISGDLLAHRKRLDELSFMKELLARNAPSVNLIEFREQLRALTTRENYYWRRPERRLAVKR